MKLIFFHIKPNVIPKLHMICFSFCYFIFLINIPFLFLKTHVIIGVCIIVYTTKMKYKKKYDMVYTTT